MVKPGTQEWLDERRKYIGASESSALFDCNPNISKFTLWHVKKGLIPDPFVPNDRTEAGLRFEEAGARWVAERNGWTIGPLGYCRHPTIEGMACTPDFEILGDKRGPGKMEFKWPDWLTVENEWRGEPPLHVQLQDQHQYPCTLHIWGGIGYVVGGNRPEFYPTEPRSRTIAEIERRVIEFFKSLKYDKYPEIDGSQSTFDAVQELCFARSDRKFTNMSDDRELLDLWQHSEEMKRIGITGGDKFRLVRSQIMMKVKGYDAVRCGNAVIKVSTIDGSEDRVITQDMIGQTIKGRKGHCRLKIVVDK